MGGGGSGLGLHDATLLAVRRRAARRESGRFNAPRASILGCIADAVLRLRGSLGAKNYLS